MRGVTTVSTRSNSARRSTPRRTYAILGLIVVVLLGLTIAGASTLTAQVGDSVERIPGVFAGSTRASGCRRRQPDLPARRHRLALRHRPPVPASPGVDPGGARSDVLMIARLNAGPHSRVRRLDPPRQLGRHPRPRHRTRSTRRTPSVARPCSSGRSRTSPASASTTSPSSISPGSGDGRRGGRHRRGHRPADERRRRQLPAGVNHLDGRAALAYVRQHDGLVGGDLIRAQRQQNALRALVTRVAEQGTLTNPGGYLRPAGRREPVGERRRHPGQRRPARPRVDLERPRAGDIYLRPRARRRVGPGGAQSVVYLDPAASAELWTALRERPRRGLRRRAHPADTLGPVTR